ncbi:MAG TPA: STAS domain-containing protein [Candidatus Gracilibacteria bacterium]|nr:STAS domain-containing protein [Candidatus Gracilibacteria bacterium]
MASNLNYTAVNNLKNSLCKGFSLRGQIDDSNKNELRDFLKSFLAGEEKFLLLDINALDYINSGVIADLIVLNEEFVANKKRFVLINPNLHIYDLINLVGFTSVVDCYASFEEAILELTD